MTDLERRFAGGDEEAFTQVVEQYSRKVHALCYRILRDEEDAKDMAQEVFVRIYSKRKAFKGRSALFTWIYRIAVNMCLSHLKKRKATMVPLDSVEGTLGAEEAGGRSIEDEDDRIEMRELVSGALADLPPKQRAVFAMRFYQKMTFKEISEAMGTSIGAAKANHHFAVAHLRRILAGGTANEESSG
jgi:RNA polymerase sigma-70 factor (ECF subfamily)